MDIDFMKTEAGMVSIFLLEKKDKCTFAIELAKKASSYLQEDKAKSLIEEAIEVARTWICIEENLGEALYNFLDNEENGFTLFQEREEDEKRINAWNCIIDGIAYISKAAYEKEGADYLPEPVELVDDNILIHMINSLILCAGEEREYIENIYQKCLEKQALVGKESGGE